MVEAQGEEKVRFRAEDFLKLSRLSQPKCESET
jgi:hypothetical protein